MLENDTARLPGVIGQLLEAAARLGLFDEATTHRVGLALHEALVNAIDHGNLELDSALRRENEAAYHRLAECRRQMLPYHRRRLHVHARIDSSAAIFVIGDQGRGFDPARLPDPTDPDGLECPSGRGLLLIRTFMDEVSFNPTGNQITLVKRRTQREPGRLR
jgi:anti-sigma regulatory factor (Ser/Thr protein kinase)